MEYIIEMKNVKKVYIDGHKKQTVAVKNFSGTFENGKFYAIMGASGAGKTTILSIMGFMDSYTEGEMFLEGRKIENLTNNQMADIRMKKIGFVFQNYFLNPKLTVEDNIILAIKINHDIKKCDYKKRVQELLGYFSVDKLAKKYPDKLSGGEQQRVCIARALANSPDIILADEPTGNLDGDNEKIVMEYLRKLADEGKTVVVVTHSDVVRKYSDKIYYMKNGWVKDEL